jgi:hypothetical protein
MRKRTGCCSLCDRLVFEVRTTFPNGNPRLLGSPLPEAHRATFVRLSGHISDVTLCDDCELTPARMPELHQNLVESSVRACAEREIALKPAAQETERRTLWCLAQDVPIGVIRTRPWREILT